MPRLIQPIVNISEGERLNNLLSKVLGDKDSFRFLSYSLMPFDRKTIDSLTASHKEHGIDYLICEEDEHFTGVLALKRNPSQGFELYLLAVDIKQRRRGIGQSLVSKCIDVAKEEGYSSIDSFVFADNKNMLQLLIRNDFIPIEIQYHTRADGMDLIKLKRII